ncbi:MAG: hypothetical protein K2G35_10900 [Duncaniella sp.]|nr:hypothetical protein [Duncaniella sp.]
MKTDLLHLNKGAMRALWRERRLLQPNIPTASEGSLSPSVFDSMLDAEIDEWYRNYLLTAPVRDCEPTDLGSLAAMVPAVGGAGVEVVLPQMVVRVTGVRMSGWRRDADIVAGPSPRLRAMQQNRFTRAGASNPLALVEHGRVYLFPPSGRLERLEVLMHDGENYSFAPGALASLRPIEEI